MGRSHVVPEVRGLSAERLSLILLDDSLEGGEAEKLSKAFGTSVALWANINRQYTDAMDELEECPGAPIAG